MKRGIPSLLLVLFLLLSIAPSRAFQAQTPVRTETNTAEHSAPVTIPFELVGRHIVLKVRVNDSKPLSFVLDTGDKVAIINLERASELGLSLGGRVRVGGAGAGTSEGARVSDATFSVDGLPGFSQPVKLALPIGILSSRMGRDFDGIIGADFISEFVVEIDYQKTVLQLHDKEKFNYAGTGEAIPMTLNAAGHPIVQAEVTPIGREPLVGKFVLDIGAGGALALHSPFVAEHNLLNSNLKTIKALGLAGAGGEVAARIGRVAELKIGKYKIAQPITLFSEDKAGAFANPAYQGNIGARVANKFRVFLDYTRGRIILEPNSSFPAPYDRSFSGVALQAHGKDYKIFRVTHVLENSPASEIGLQQQDIITEIDGKPASQLTLTKVNEMFEKNVSYNLTVQRGEQMLKVKLTPRKLI